MASVREGQERQLGQSAFLSWKSRPGRRLRRRRRCRVALPLSLSLSSLSSSLPSSRSHRRCRRHAVVVADDAADVVAVLRKLMLSRIRGGALPLESQRGVSLMIR